MTIFSKLPNEQIFHEINYCYFASSKINNFNWRHLKINYCCWTIDNYFVWNNLLGKPARDPALLFEITLTISDFVTYQLFFNTRKLLLIVQPHSMFWLFCFSLHVRFHIFTPPFTFPSCGYISRLIGLHIFIWPFLHYMYTSI